MKPFCVALLALGLAAFAPEQGQNQLLCRSHDASSGETLELTTKFSRIADLFLILGEVRLDGRFAGQEIHRAFPAGDFQMNTQIDRDGRRRLAIHSRSGRDDRLRWFIRDGAGADAFDFEFPRKLGEAPASGRFAGSFEPVDPSAPPARTAECSSGRSPDY